MSNTMENMTEEQELTEAEKFLIKKSQECPPFTHDGLNQLPYILVPAVAKCMEEFVQFSLYKDHPTTASGSVAAPKEEKSEDFGKLKWKVGQILAEQFLKYNDGKFIAAIELNPATHALTEFIESENTALREALKELLPIVERKFNGISIDDAASHREYIALKAIIERARKLILK